MRGLARLGTGAVVAGCVAAAFVAGALASAGAPAYADDEKTDYEWSIDLDCSLCHEAQYESLGLAADGTPAADAGDGAAEAADLPAGKDEKAEGDETDSETGDEAEINGYAAMHAQALGLTCVTCHEDTDGLAKGHKKLNSGKEATRLKQSEVAREVCLMCHDADDLTEATADCTVLTDAEGTVVNPHDLPDVVDHEGIDCTDCHTVHAADNDVATSAYNTCVDCHHAEVFECNTCH